jgi:hypothetical protein
MKKLLGMLILALIGVGCHAQVPPTNHVVNLSWTAPLPTTIWPGCATASPCLYIVSRATVASSTSSCPAPNIDTPNYKPMNQSIPTSGTAYSDPTASGLTVCYIVQTQQGTAISSPSGTTNVINVPANPLAPVLQTPLLAENKMTAFPKPTSNFVSASPSQVTARIASR